MRLSEIASPTVPVLYHGTTLEHAKRLLANGWSPETHPGAGGNMGQKRFLYLSTGFEDAQWFSNEKGCDVVLALSNVPMAALIVDPEDGCSGSVEEELANERTIGIPGKVALTQPLPAQHFSMVNESATDR